MPQIARPHHGCPWRTQAAVEALHSSADECEQLRELLSAAQGRCQQLEAHAATQLQALDAHAAAARRWAPLEAEHARLQAEVGALRSQLAALEGELAAKDRACLQLQHRCGAGAGVELCKEVQGSAGHGLNEPRSTSPLGMRLE